MFEFFKRKKKPQFIYKHLEPTERISTILEEYILPEVALLGFRFFKSELVFKRHFGEFEHSISFQKSKWNSGNAVCAVKPIFGFQSGILANYHKEISGAKDGAISLGGEYDVTNIEGWDTTCFDGYYDFAKNDNIELIKILGENILNAGVKYLDQFETYKDLISYYFKARTKYFLAPHLFDLCVLHEDRDSAELVLKWFNEFESNTEKHLPDSLIGKMRKREADDLI